MLFANLTRQHLHIYFVDIVEDFFAIVAHFACRSIVIYLTLDRAFSCNLEIDNFSFLEAYLQTLSRKLVVSEQ